MAELPNCPASREEAYLASIAGEGVEVPPCPRSRKEAYLDAIDGKMDDIEQEIEDLKNNPDVVDIVDTYADLQAYDTSALTDKDVIRVLNDETHDGNSTFYRWNAATSSFDYIGEAGSSVDVFVGTDGIEPGEKGLVPAPLITDAGKVLSASGSWTEVPKEIIQNAGAPTTSTAGTLGQLLTDTTNAKLYQLTAIDTTDPQNPSYTWTEVGGSSINVVQTTGTSTTDVMSQDATTKMLYPYPGQYKRTIRIGADTNVTGSHRISIGDFRKNIESQTVAGILIGRGVTGVYAIGDWCSASGSRAIRIGTSRTTDVVGGDSTKSVASGTSSTAIGDDCSARADYATSLGGYEAHATGAGSLALGSFSSATAQGQADIGVNVSGYQSSYGYNGSAYRLLTGLYDPQSDHDATTKGYVDNAVINGGTTAPTTSTVGAVGTQYTCVNNGTPEVYVCTDTTGGTYTWTKIY